MSSGKKGGRTRPPRPVLDLDRLGVLPSERDGVCLVHNPRGYRAGMGAYVEAFNDVYLTPDSVVTVHGKYNGFQVRVIQLHDGTVMIIKEDNDDVFGDYIAGDVVWPPNPCTCRCTINKS